MSYYVPIYYISCKQDVWFDGSNHVWYSGTILSVENKANFFMYMCCPVIIGNLLSTDFPPQISWSQVIDHSSLHTSRLLNPAWAIVTFTRTCKQIHHSDSVVQIYLWMKIKMQQMCSMFMALLCLKKYSTLESCATAVFRALFMLTLAMLREWLVCKMGNCE